MKILILCLVLLAVNSLVPNCAFQSNNRCLSCYYGFDLVAGRCDTCSVGFVMVKEICVDQNLYQQQVNSLNQVNTQQQTQTQTTTTSSSTPTTTSTTTVLPTQNTQLISQPQTTQTTNTVTSTSVPTQTSTTTTTSTVSSSNGITFDISNSGVMYLLQTFGLTSKIPSNCQQFTSDFRCVKCVTGFAVSPSATCVLIPVSGSTGSGSSSTSQSSSQTSQTSTSTTQQQGSTTTTTGTTTTGTVQNTDPNCQIPGSNGQCSKCYFRFFYNSVSRRCEQVSDLCATWNNFGNCLTCYGGYRLTNGACVIESQSTGSGSTSSSTSGSTTQQQSSTGQSSSSTTSTTTQQQTGTVTGQQQSGSSSSTTSTTVSTPDPNCKTSGANGVCYECYYSYYVNPQTSRCASVNPLCQTWNYLGHCFSCFPGYVLSGTQCVMSGSSGSSGSSSSTGSSSGSSSSSSTGSGSSSSSSTGSGSSSSSSTGSVSGGSSSSTTTTTTGSSSVITSGTSSGSSSGQINIINPDPNCRIPNSDGTCNTCYNSFYYDSFSAKRCVQVSPLCKTWNSLGHCQSCYQGYYLYLNNCVIDPLYAQSSTVSPDDLPPTNQDPFCNTYKNQVCVKCAPRTYLDPTSKRCLAVDSNCMQWTQTGICTVCYNGYYLFNQRECKLFYPEVASVQLKSDLNTDINCRASDSKGVCTQCIWRFVLNQTTKVCMKVNDQCRTWSDSTALCTSCYGGYTLSTAGECRLSF